MEISFVNKPNINKSQPNPSTTCTQHPGLNADCQIRELQLSTLQLIVLRVMYVMFMLLLLLLLLLPMQVRLQYSHVLCC